MSYIDRMREELSSLEGKLEKLVAFVESDAVKELDETERALLTVQRHAMEAYRHVLSTRLNRAP